MKSTILSALVVLTASLVPLKMKAVEPAAIIDNTRDTDNVAALIADIDDPTNAFVRLDDGSNAGTGYSSVSAEEVIDYASKFLGRPYRRGSGGPKAFDCSGFTSFVFRNFDISLSRSSRDQYGQGVSISRNDIQPGDLLFFAGRRGGKTVGHVAIATSVNEDGTVDFIHASTTGGIRHDRYPDGGYYSQRFIGARRVLN
ncbi:MAG: C40 family peptidase [Muribaculaceae bacterium]